MDERVVHVDRELSDASENVRRTDPRLSYELGHLLAAAVIGRRRYVRIATRQASGRRRDSHPPAAPPDAHDELAGRVDAGRKRNSRQPVLDRRRAVSMRLY